MKSMILADLALSVATGQNWLPIAGEHGTGYKTQKSGVLWIDCDNGKRRTSARFEAIGRALDAPHDAPFYYVSMPNPPLNLSDRESLETLCDNIKKLDAKLVIIDNLGLVTGNTDENGAGMASVMAGLRQIAEATGAAVAVIHHQRKTKDEATMNVIRGNSSIAASLDLAILVDRQDEGNVLLSAAKSRDADIPLLSAKFSFEHVDGTRELRSARFWGQKIADTKSPKAVDETIIYCLRESPGMNQTEIVDAVTEHGINAGRNKILARIKHLVSMSIIVAKTGAYNSKIYAICA